MTAAASFNGGRTQTNLNYLQTGGEYPFKNVLKTAQAWGYASAPNQFGHLDPATLDANGYPTTLQSGGCFAKCFIPASWVGQSLTMAWDGNGTVRTPGTLTSAVGSDTSSSGSGVLTCTALAQDIYPGIVSTAASPNHIRNIRVCLTSEFAAHEAGDIFGVKFKQRLAEANFGVLRSLNWMKINDNNQTTWATRKPLAFYSYEAFEFRASLYCTGCTNSGNAYSITGNGLGVPSSVAPVDKQIVQFQYSADATQSGTCSLNFNGTCAVNILDQFSSALSVNGNSYPKRTNSGGVNLYTTLIYDAVLNAWIAYGGDMVGESFGINSGVPSELLVQLCAEIGAHPWFIVPHLACDPATDFATSLATYCRDNGPSWMIPRFEPVNEQWNNGFRPSQYSIKKSALLWSGGNFHDHYGKILSVMGQAISTVYSADRTKYQVMCGVQTATGTDASGTASSDERLASSKYIAQAAAAQSPYTKSAAKNWTTHICTAQYFTPSLYNTAEETAMAAAYAAGDAATKTALANSYSDSVNSGSGLYKLSDVKLFHTNWKTWAQGFGINKLCGYEGGYSPDYTGGGTSQADILRDAGKASPNLYGYTIDAYMSVIRLNDSIFTGEFPSNYLIGDFGVSTTYAWSAFRGDIWSANTGIWNAIVAFNTGKRAVDPRLRIHG